MAIQLTERAAEHVRSMLEQHAGSIGLRLGTRKSGCSGFAYIVDYVDTVGEGDTRKFWEGEAPAEPMRSARLVHQGSPRRKSCRLCNTRSTSGPPLR